MKKRIMTTNYVPVPGETPALRHGAVNYWPLALALGGAFVFWGGVAIAWLAGVPYLNVWHAFTVVGFLIGTVAWVSSLALFLAADRGKWLHLLLFIGLPVYAVAVFLFLLSQSLFC